MDIFDPNDVYNRISKMHNEIEKMFNTIMMPESDKQIEKSKPDIRQPRDVLKETESSLLATINLPSTSEDKIDLDIRNNSIGIIAKRKVESQMQNVPGGQKMQVMKKVLPLPKPIDPEKTVAMYQDGILKLDMPKINIKPKRLNLQ